jgi:hypothetical protein
MGGGEQKSAFGPGAGEVLCCIHDSSPAFFAVDIPGGRLAPFDVSARDLSHSVMQLPLSVTEHGKSSRH